jgi:hypothetical protein
MSIQTNSGLKPATFGVVSSTLMIAGIEMPSDHIKSAASQKNGREPTKSKGVPASTSTPSNPSAEHSGQHDFIAMPLRLYPHAGQLSGACVIAFDTREDYNRFNDGAKLRTESSGE